MSKVIHNNCYSFGVRVLAAPQKLLTLNFNTNNMFEQLTTKSGKKLINKTTKIPVYKESVEHRIITLCKILYGQDYKAFLPRAIFN